jgi:nitroreductase
VDIYQAIAGRHTIRDFSTQPVDPEITHRIISAGLQAPTNDHMRQWHFVVLQDLERRKALLDRVIKPVGKRGALGIINRWGLTDPVQRECYLDAIPKQYAMLMNSTCLIIPCYWQPSLLLKPKTLSDLNYFASAWACVENILLAAVAEGLQGVTRIPFEAERRVMKEFLCIREGYEIPCWIALGYPAEDAFQVTQVKVDLEDRIHIDQWEPDPEQAPAS